jgi:purine-nucleoside phosphorylase
MQAKSTAQKVQKAAKFIAAKAGARWRPDVAIILGSGLASAVPQLGAKKVIPFKSIPGFPSTTVAGHDGRLVLGSCAGKTQPLRVAILQGRFHYYEGHSMADITLPIRALRALGLKTLLITSAVGSMRKGLKPGHICVINDHVNFMGHNPLRAHHTREYGEMFPDMAGAYTPALRKKAMAQLKRLKIPCREGVYTAVSGPSYETPAEIRAFAALGGDVVGMSVVPEVIVARQMGLDVLALSWIANMAAGISAESLSHKDVLALGAKMSMRLKGALTAMLRRI